MVMEEGQNWSEDEEEYEEGKIYDLSEKDLVNLRRTIYLVIVSSIDYEDCAHKLLKMNIREGQEMEICNMILECC
jgi:pre-mRNA-splicing factor CWC22